MLRIFILFLFVLLVTPGAKAQLSNPGFETVQVSGTDTLPDHWILGSYGNGLNPNAHSGTRAVSVWNWYYYAKGIVVNGSDNLLTIPTPGSPYLYGGEPIAIKPNALSGYYLYDTTANQGNTDSAFVQIVLSRYNTASQAREAVGFGEARLPVMDHYTQFNIPVTYTSALMPDTIVVVLMSSLNGMCDISSSGYCLYFTVDDLALETSSGLVEFGKKHNGWIYPNPAREVLNIDASDRNETLYNCTLVDMNGRQVLQQEMIRNKIVVNTTTLEPGFYIYQLHDRNGTTLLTGKAEIMR